MRGRLYTLVAAIAALAGCAVAPIVNEGGGFFSIGDSGRDSFRTNSSANAHNHSRAVEVCRTMGRNLRIFDQSPPDGRYHFECVEPPPPPPKPAPPPPPPPPPPPVFATPKEIADAQVDWRQCQEAAEPLIDDMLSDANTVATVLATLCELQFESLLDLTQKGWTSKLPASAFHQVRHDVALDIVLQVRAKKRNPSKAPPPVTIPKLTPERL